MSRAQSFMSMAAWPKSKPNKVRYLKVSKRRKGMKRDEKTMTGLHLERLGKGKRRR
jgi:hypothetical protein